jgi:uncharacterized protein (TIGR02271 family)
MASRKIIAVFDSEGAAQAAADSLAEMGVSRERISIAGRDSERRVEGENARGGFWAHVREMFMPDEDRATLEECVTRGGYVVSASVNDEEIDEAIARLERSGAVDLSAKEAEWRAAGWKGRAAEARPDTDAPRTAGATEEDSIPVVEERLRIGKREVNRGGVRVRSYIVEEPVHEEVQLRQERVEVERRPVNQPARPVSEGSPQDLMKEQTIEVSETSEEAVVSKDAVITEEVNVRKVAEERTEQIDEKVRRTEVEVEPLNPPGGSAPRRPSTRPTPGGRH